MAFRCSPVRSRLAPVPPVEADHLRMKLGFGFGMQARRMTPAVMPRCSIGALAPKFRSDARSPRSPAPGLPGPERTEALSMPANHRLGVNDVERLAPPCPTPREPDPESAIQRPEPWSLRPAAEQGELRGSQAPDSCES